MTDEKKPDVTERPLDELVGRETQQERNGENILLRPDKPGICKGCVCGAEQVTALDALPDSRRFVDWLGGIGAASLAAG